MCQEEGSGLREEKEIHVRWERGKETDKKGESECARTSVSEVGGGREKGMEI